MPHLVWSFDLFSVFWLRIVFQSAAFPCRLGVFKDETISTSVEPSLFIFEQAGISSRRHTVENPARFDECHILLIVDASFLRLEGLPCQRTGK